MGDQYQFSIAGTVEFRSTGLEIWNPAKAAEFFRKLGWMQMAEGVEDERFDWTNWCSRSFGPAVKLSDDRLNDEVRSSGAWRLHLNYDLARASLIELGEEIEKWLKATSSMEGADLTIFFDKQVLRVTIPSVFAFIIEFHAVPPRQSARH